jgi:uncharacterized lipoprotein YajG
MKDQCIPEQRKGRNERARLLKCLKLAGVFLVFASLLSGCALTKEYVTLSYQPQTNVEKIKGADAVKVKVEISDVRMIKDKVSCKKNGYGMEMAPIIAQNDVAEILKVAIEAELKNRGFNLAEGSMLVFAELTKYYNDFKTGFWSGRAVAEVVMNVQVKKQDHSIIFSRIIAGESTISNLQLASGKNAKLALDDALKNGVSKLFNDAAFIDSLFKAASN